MGLQFIYEQFWMALPIMNKEMKLAELINDLKI